MSDSAPAFVHTSHPGIVDAHHVNHNDKEFARSVEALANTMTRKLRPATASSNAIEREWGIMKDETEWRGTAAATPQGRKRLTTAIRAGQWRRFASTFDRWPLYCRAVMRMRAGNGELNAKPWPKRTCFGPDWVVSKAGGLAARCQHIEADTAQQCSREAHVCCTACFIPLCTVHTGELNGEGERFLQSRCHEHTTDPVVASVCPCQDCSKVVAVLDN